MAAPEAPLLYEGVSRSSAAFRLLKQMGWEEGEGLGKEKQGITKHVRVVKKKDNSGVGVDAQQKAANNWTFNTTTFDSILKNLNVIIADTSQEDDMQKKTVTNEAKHEIAAPFKKATRPQGRYKKRELGKVLKGKSQADLDAILGYGKLTHRELWSPLDGSKVISEKSLSLDTFCVPAERLARANNTTSSIRDDRSVGLPPTVSIAIDWWGTRYGFVPAVALERQKNESEMSNGEQKSVEATQLTKLGVSFSEQDQEDLYKLVQDKATKGRKGLGIADRSKKIGGAHWKGQKVMLDIGDDDELENGVVDVLEDGTSRIMDRADGCNEMSEDERAMKRRKQDKPKWKNLCQRLLQEAPNQTMKIKNLHRKIVDFHLGNGEGGCMQPSILSKKKFKEKLTKSSKFVIEGKKVSLVASL